MFGRDRKMEEFFNRQAEQAEADMAMYQRQMQKARLIGYSALDPHAAEVYRRQLQETGSESLAEIAAARAAQRSILHFAFSVFDDWV